VLAQYVGRDDGAGLEAEAERIEVDDLVLDAERIVETALRNAAVQRHLAALEAALELEARPRLRALVPAVGGLAVARSLAAADPLLRVCGARRRTQIVQRHCLLHFDQMTDLVDHAARGRRVLELHGVANPPQAERLDDSDLAVLEANRAIDERHLDGGAFRIRSMIHTSDSLEVG